MKDEGGGTQRIPDSNFIRSILPHHIHFLLPIVVYSNEFCRVLELRTSKTVTGYSLTFTEKSIDNTARHEVARLVGAKANLTKSS